MEDELSTVDTAAINHKLSVVKEVMKEMVLVDIQGGAHNRLDPEMIDSFLLAELVDNGIDQPYEFGVFDAANMPIFDEPQYALKLIWGDDSYFNARSMDVYITKLRKYLKEDPSVEIVNVHGRGFKLLGLK